MEFTRRSVLSSTIAATMLGLTEQPVLGRTFGTGRYELSGKKAIMARAALDLIAAVPKGEGREMTMFISSLCPYCKNFIKRYPSLIVPGIRMRYAPYPLDDQESGAVQRVIAQPDLPTLRRYLAGQYRSVPPIPYQRGVTPELPAITPAEMYTKQARLIYRSFAIFREDGSPDATPSTPAFFFSTADGNVYLLKGTPTDDMFAELAKLR